MSIENIKALQRKVKNLEDALLLVQEEWDGLTPEELGIAESGFPFPMSIEDMHADTANWSEELKEVSERKIYKVGVREVWEQMYEVEANSKEEAIEKINNGKMNVLEGEFEWVGYSDEPNVFYE